MKSDLPAGSSLNKIFAALFLVTGSRAGAEKAMLSAIASLNPDTATTCDSRLLHASIAAALSLEDEARTELEFDYAPREMHNLLHLAREIRTCFVLRVLLRVPARLCAGLLHLDADSIERNVRLAVLCLTEDCAPAPAAVPLVCQISTEAAALAAHA